MLKERLTVSSQNIFNFLNITVGQLLKRTEQSFHLEVIWIYSFLKLMALTFNSALRANKIQVY